MQHLQETSNQELELTKQSVLLSYHGFKDKSHSPKIDDHKTLQILHLLGGIDHILEAFLCNDDIQTDLNQTQLNQLNRMFLTSHTIVTKNNKLQTLQRISAANAPDDETHNIHNKMRHTFDISNTYLHDIWGETFALKAVKIIHSKSAHALCTLCMIVAVILHFTIPYHLIYTVYFLIVVGICGHFYLSMWLLSANKTAMQLVIHTFEFWFKFGSVLLFTSLMFITKHIYGRGTPLRDNALRVITDILGLSNIILFVVTVSMFDALHINRVSKIWFSGTASLLTTSLLIYQTYVYYFGSDSIVNVTVRDNVSLSLISMQNNIMEVLVLFYWKQFIMTMLKKDQCVLIKYSPYIEWIDQATRSHIINAIASNQPPLEMDSYKRYEEVEEDEDMKRIPTAKTDLRRKEDTKEPSTSIESALFDPESSDQ